MIQNHYNTTFTTGRDTIARQPHHDLDATVSNHYQPCSLLQKALGEYFSASASRSALLLGEARAIGSTGLLLVGKEAAADRDCEGTACCEAIDKCYAALLAWVEGGGIARNSREIVPASPARNSESLNVFCSFSFQVILQGQVCYLGIQLVEQPEVQALLVQCLVTVSIPSCHGLQRRHKRSLETMERKCKIALQLANLKLFHNFKSILQIYCTLHITLQFACLKQVRYFTSFVQTYLMITIIQHFFSNHYIFAIITHVIWYALMVAT